MSLQTITAPLYWPASILAGGGQPGVASLTVDAAGDSAALIFQSPFTGNLRKIHFRTSTVSFGDDVDVRVETVDPATGDPTGTLVGTNTNGTVTIASTDDNVIKTATLTADASLTRGTVYAIVIVLASSAGTMQFATFDVDGSGHDFPYSDAFVAAAWSKNVRRLICAIEDSAGVFHHLVGVHFTETFTQRSYNNTSTPDVWGVRFRVPFSCKVDGFWANFDLDGDATVKLYDSDGVSVLASFAMDTNIRFGTAVGIKRGLFAEVTLLKDTYYYLGIEPSSGTNIAVITGGIPNALGVAAMGAWPGGADFHVASAKDPTGTGSWTHYNNTTDGMFMAWMGLSISALDDGGPTNVEIATAVWAYANRTLTS